MLFVPKANVPVNPEKVKKFTVGLIPKVTVPAPEANVEIKGFDEHTCTIIAYNRHGPGYPARFVFQNGR